MLFDFLKDITYRKQGDLLDNPENESEFVPYLISRWLSMQSSDMLNLLNNTTNKLYTVFENKKEWYNMFLCIIPKSYFKNVKYIKKTKKEKVTDNYDDVIEFLAKNQQISQREVELYIKEFNIDTKDLKKAIKVK